MKRRVFFLSASAAAAAGAAGYSFMPESSSRNLSLALMGGFLGSGKSSFLWKSALALQQRGLSVGFITNDQAADVVDTGFLLQQQANVHEIAGGCFCCRFDALEDALQDVRQRGAQVVLAEPVGSCTDLTATVVQPIRRWHPEIALAPYSVMAEPARILEAFEHKQTDWLSNVMYIFRKQVEEADVILLSKSDMTSPQERAKAREVLRKALPGRPVYDVSAETGSGMDTWLDVMLHHHNAGRHVVDVDYDRYGDGEEALGWLNAVVRLDSPASAGNPRGVVHRVLDTMNRELAARQAPVGHGKASLANETESVIGNITQTNPGVSLRSCPETRTSHRGLLTVNLRAQARPDELDDVFRASLAALQDNNARIQSLQCFAPARPVPTYRFAESV